MEITEIKKQLPVGAGKEIAKMSGVNYDTVQRFFRGIKVKETLKLMESTAKYLEEYKNRKKELEEKLKAVATA